MFEEEGVIQHAYLKNSGRGISRFKGCEVRECNYVYASSTVITDLEERWEVRESQRMGYRGTGSQPRKVLLGHL